MSNEIFVNYPGTKTPIAMLFEQATSKVWSFADSAWESYSAGNIDNYDLVLSEGGVPNVYYGDFPTGISSGTTVLIAIYERQSSTVAVGDLEYPLTTYSKLWNGSSLSDDTVGSTLSNVQEVRLYVGDTDATYFSNDEINLFINRADEDLFLAASYALRSLAADASKLAIVANEGDHERDTRAVSRELSRRANEYAQMSSSTAAYAVAESNDAISSILGIIGANQERI